VFRVYRAHVLTWIGIVGSAVTVLGSISPFLDLADWCRGIVDLYHLWTGIFWDKISELIKFDIPEEIRTILLAAIFTFTIAVGVRLAAIVKGDTDRLHMERDPAGYMMTKIGEIVRAETGLRSDDPVEYRAARRRTKKATLAVENEVKETNANRPKDTSTYLRNPLFLIYVVVCGAGFYNTGFSLVDGNSDYLLAAMVGFTAALFAALSIAPINRVYDRARWVFVGVFFIVCLNYISLLAQALRSGSLAGGI